MEFIVLGDRIDYHVIPYSGFNSIQNCRYVEDIDSKSRFLKTLYRVHTSPKFFHGKAPFQKIWFPVYYQDRRKKIEKKYFLIFSRKLDIVGIEYIDYLKHRYPDATYVCVFQDLVSTHKHSNIDYLKSVFDMILSFDYAEAEKYQILYFPLIYSRMEIEEETQTNSDVYFVGRAKNRIDDIKKAYHTLKSLGLKLDFYVIGAREQDKADDGIKYIDNMPYKENIDRIKHTRCLYEPVQANGSSSTLRLSEAIAFKKKILTNAEYMVSSELFDERYVYVYSRVSQIDKAFVTFLVCEDQPDYEWLQKQISPGMLLEYIVNKDETDVQK